MIAAARLRRVVWALVIFLAIIGIAVAVRRIAHLVPVVVWGYQPPRTTANPRIAQFIALDDLFARHATLTLVHIVPSLLFMLLGPLQFSYLWTLDCHATPNAWAVENFR